MEDLIEAIKIGKKIYKMRNIIAPIITIILILCIIVPIIEDSSHKKYSDTIKYVNEVSNKMQFDIKPGRLGTNIPEVKNQLQKGRYEDEYKGYINVSEEVIKVLYKYENVKDKEIQYIFNGYDNDFYYYTLKDKSEERHYKAQYISKYKNKAGIDKLYTEATYAVFREDNKGNPTLINKEDVIPSKKQQEKIRQKQIDEEINGSAYD